MPETAPSSSSHARAPADSTEPVNPQQLSRLLAVHADATDYYLRRVAGSWVPTYLIGRSLGEALDPAHGLGLGYAPRRWTGLVDHLRDAGYTDATLTEAGLALTARTGHLIDRFRDRLVIPLHDGGGRVIAFTARAAPTASPDVPKYVNSPTTALYVKGKHLYGLHAASRLAAAGATPVLVEGPLDAIAVRLAAPHTAAPTAACGTALSRHHAQLLAVLATIAAAAHDPYLAGCPDTTLPAPTGRVTVALDGDAHPYGLELLHADLGPECDPALALHRDGRDVLRAALNDAARPLVDVLVDRRLDASADRFPEIEAGVAATRAAAPLLADLEPRHRERLAEGIAARTGMHPTTVHREIAAARLSAMRQGPLGAPTRQHHAAHALM
jgi:DNA primase catalytic core